MNVSFRAPRPVSAARGADEPSASAPVATGVRVAPTVDSAVRDIEALIGELELSDGEVRAVLARLEASLLFQQVTRPAVDGDEAVVGARRARALILSGVVHAVRAQAVEPVRVVDVLASAPSGEPSTHPDAVPPTRAVDDSANVDVPNATPE